MPHDTIVPDWDNPADTEVRFDHETLVFGNVMEGDMVEAVFEFTNVGQQLLEIEIVSACDCMEMEWTQEEIPNGQRGFVAIVLNTAAMSGKISKDIDIVFKNTDADGYPLVKRVYLVGAVEPRH